MGSDAQTKSDGPPDVDSPPRDEVEHAILLARRLQQRAGELQTSAERRQQAELDRMIQSPADKATLVEITDQAFRARRALRAADQLVHILDVQGVPRFFSALDRALLSGFRSFGAYLPGVAMPLVRDKMQHETANVVLPAEEELLRDHLQQRSREGLRMNVNYLGESLLGEADAERRLHAYLAALARPEIEVMSVKISTIYSQISALARQHTVELLSDRLELLYRAGAKARYTRADGTVVPKFVYLDMEEYRDKAITAAAFMQTLDRPGLQHVTAGIALQAYLPDSFATQQEITAWARRRVAGGGAPVTIRLVKGANMEMERVEASLRNWPLATFSDKLDTDANYLRMLRFGMQRENLAAVQIGVASHNLFTVAYGLTLAAGMGADDAALEHVQFEMLEGMANHQRRALAELLAAPRPLQGRPGEGAASDARAPSAHGASLLLYAPACRQEDFTSAIGYLVRRLDENTGPDNFLRHAFRLEVDGPPWRRLEQTFRDSFARIDALRTEPLRTQNRLREAECGGVTREPPEQADPTSQATSAPPPSKGGARGGTLDGRPGHSPHAASDFRPPTSDLFSNIADTDWSLPQNSHWAAGILDAWRDRHAAHSAAGEVPLEIAGETILDRPVRPSHDPSRPGTVVAHYRQATAADIERAVQCAADDPDGWRRRSPAERTAVLNRAADELARRRGDLLGAMLAEGGKLLAEGDPEVSEAIDFCRYYGARAEEFYALAALAAQPRGVVAVVSPWNFPLAIPCGGVAAALAAGNTVLLKPASDTVLIAHALCECFWAAGTPRTALQFVPCSGASEGQQLVSHNGVDAVVLTGGTETAQAMLARKPTLHLLAETGGKNATIVTALADRDLAIKNVLHSAFSHSGQKCSATSLLILEDEVYHDRRFRDTLCDAVESLRVGSAWDLATKMGPLIHPPAGPMERALKELEPGESWAVMPRLHIDGNPCLVSPGVKWGVTAGTFTHSTELFGPVLGVMRASDLGEAIDLVHATGYGLTSGLESLDDREQRQWQQALRAGNLYINRSTTGAVVQRQPFGGMGKSAFGPGVKAGGPNYVAPLMRFTDETAGGEIVNGAPSPLAAATGHAAGDHLAALRAALAEPADRPPLTAEDRCRLVGAIHSYAYWAAQEFGAEHDPQRLLGEDNIRRYLPADPLWIRIHDEDDAFEIFARACAARAAGRRIVVSSPPELAAATRDAVALLDSLTDSWAAAIEFIVESDAELAAALGAGRIGRVRYAAPHRVPVAIRRTAADAFVHLPDAPPLAHGRVELLWYLQEQSVTRVYHRYGNLGRRATEPRTPAIPP